MKTPASLYFTAVWQCLSLVACMAASSAFAADPPMIPAVKPHTGLIYRWVAFPGTLAPWQQVTLYAKVSGYIKKITVDKGDVIKAGQILTEIEVPELEADLIKSKAEVEVAQIEVNRMHEARSKSPDLVLPQAVDDAEAKLKIARASQNRVIVMLEFAKIKAPFDGIVTSRYVDNGAFVPAVTAGSTAQTAAIIRAVDAHVIRAQAAVTESESFYIKPGLPVKVILDSMGGRAIEATVSRSAYALDEATRTLLVEADLKNEDNSLRPGLYATIKFAVEKHENAMLVPVTALVMEKTNAFVFKAVNGNAVKTAVVPAFNDGVQVEIPTLKPDDVLLLPGTTVLTDAQTINVNMQP